MIVNVIETVKNAIMVFTTPKGEVRQSVTTLNSGMMIKAEYVQKLPDNKGNIHVIDGSVILDVDRDSISFDKKQNNNYISSIESSGGKRKARIAPSIDSENLSPPKIRRSCCGG